MSAIKSFSYKSFKETHVSVLSSMERVPLICVCSRTICSHYPVENNFRHSFALITETNEMTLQKPDSYFYRNAYLILKNPEIQTFITSFLFSSFTPFLYPFHTFIFFLSFMNSLSYTRSFTWRSLAHRSAIRVSTC